MSKQIEVNLQEQVLEAFDGTKKVFTFECVTGDDDHPTNKGLFKIFWKHHPHRSRKYNVQMNYAMFFTRDGKAIHQYHGPMPLGLVRTMKKGISEWFGSHGCVRLSEADATTLYAWTPVGTSVHIR